MNDNNISEIELVYKTKVKPSDRPRIINSQDSSRIFRERWDKDKIDFIEQFKVIYLNRSSGVLALYELSTGGITGTVADIRLILAAAVKLNATAIILCHNHPSGALKPSHADETLTQKIKQASLLHDILLMDHIILSSEGYFSFADEGLI
jgi:DNA repair protein RadC